MVMTTSVTLPGSRWQALYATGLRETEFDSPDGLSFDIISASILSAIKKRHLFLRECKSQTSTSPLFFKVQCNTRVRVIYASRIPRFPAIYFPSLLGSTSLTPQSCIFHVDFLLCPESIVLFFLQGSFYCHFLKTRVIVIIFHIFQKVNSQSKTKSRSEKTIRQCSPLVCVPVYIHEIVAQDMHFSQLQKTIEK